MRTTHFLVVMLVVMLFSCSKENKSANKEASDSSSDSSILNSTLTDEQDSERIFKKTGDIDMDVEDVYKSTKALEKAVVEASGYVVKSDLSNEIIDQKKVALSKDSAMQWIKNRNEAYIIAKIPQQNLGSFLQQIETEILYLHERDLQADELTFQSKLNQMQQQSDEESKSQLNQSIDEGGKLKDKTNAINEENAMANQINQLKYQKMLMEHESKMAEVRINLKGKEQLAQMAVVNFDHYNEMRNNFGYDLKNAFVNGYNIFLQIIIYLMYLWPYVLVFFLIYYLHKYFKRKGGILQALKLQKS